MSAAAPPEVNLASGVVGSPVVCTGSSCDMPSRCMWTASPSGSLAPLSRTGTNRRSGGKSCSRSARTPEQSGGRFTGVTATPHGTVPAGSEAGDLGASDPSPPASNWNTWLLPPPKPPARKTEPPSGLTASPKASADPAETVPGDFGESAPPGPTWYCDTSCPLLFETYTVSPSGRTATSTGCPCAGTVASGFGDSPPPGPTSYWETALPHSSATYTDPPSGRTAMPWGHPPAGTLAVLLGARAPSAPISNWKTPSRPVT